MTAGAMPSRTSLKASFAESTAMTMSQAATSTQSSTHSRAVDAPDDGAGERINGLEEIAHRQRILQVLFLRKCRRCLHCVQVGPRAKDWPVAGKHDRVQARVRA